MNTKSHLIYGIPAALLSILLFVAGTYNASLPTDGFILSWGPRILLFAGILLSCLDYRKKTEGATFGNTFANGFRTTAVITVLFAIFVAIFIVSLPGFKEKILAEAAANAAKSGYEASAIKENQERLAAMIVPITMAGITVTHLVMGAVFSAITAAILKKQ